MMNFQWPSSLFWFYSHLGIFKNMLRLQAFRTMGRLTFGAYLIHPTIIRLMYGNMRSPFWTDDFRVVIISSFFSGGLHK